MTLRVPLSLALLVGCAPAPSEPTPTSGEHLDVSDDALPDVNTTSPRFGDDVRSSDYLGQRSAWYFGHAT